MEKKTVNILGTEYEIEFDFNDKEADGEARFYQKKILIRPQEKMLDKDSTENEKIGRQKEVVRHELWHCILHEAGMDSYACDEKLIEALAILSPKAFKLFLELGVTGNLDLLGADAEWIRTGTLKMPEYLVAAYGKENS